MKINEVTEPVVETEMTTQQRQLSEIGRTLMDMAITNKDDEESNNMSKLGDTLTQYGAAFGPKNLQDVVKKTGLNPKVIQGLLQKAQAQLKSAGPVRKGAEVPDEEPEDY
jgi:hypothetical protein